MRELFTDEEWETLLLAPFFVNHATGMIDDQLVDQSESQALVDIVASNMLYAGDPLTKEVCEAIVSDSSATIDRMDEVSGTVTPADVITAAGQLADRVAALGYKQMIVDVCEATANASEARGGLDPAARDRKLQAVSWVKEMLDLPG